MWWLSVVNPTAEFCTADGGGDGHVEAFGCGLTGGVGGDEKTVGEAGADGVAQAVALVAHHEKAFLREWGLVEARTIEQRAIDGSALGKMVDENGKVGGDDGDACNASHSGLHHFGAVGIGSVAAAEYRFDAKPVGDADDGSHIAWILHTIESEA